MRVAPLRPDNHTAQALTNTQPQGSRHGLLCVLLCLFIGLPAVRNFTLFAPTDKAIQQAYRSGALNYPYLFAKNKTLLEGIVAYHAVPQFQFAGPSKQTVNMRTLLSEVSSPVSSLSLGAFAAALTGCHTFAVCNKQYHSCTKSCPARVLGSQEVTLRL